MKATTLKDVAMAVGVSVRTVSNVVNDYAHVSAEMRLRVQEACDRLGYRPNAAARQLRSGKTGLLALVVPEIAIPYFAELAQTVIGEARRAGYGVLIDQTDGDIKLERELILQSNRGPLFDGVIFSPLHIGAAELGERMNIPFVLLGEHLLNAGFDHVTIDNVAAARDATAHLISLGRRRIAAIGAHAAGETARLRTLGYIAAHEEAGLDVDESLLMSVAEFHRDSGAEAMRQLLRQHPAPDAIFCFSDLLALGAARTALEQGLRIPQDLAIVGFDDIEEGRYHTPSLTTIAPDKSAIARLAVGRLVDRLSTGKKPLPSQMLAPYALIARESSYSALNTAEKV